MIPSTTFGLKQHQIEAIVNVVASCSDIKSARIFGSRALGTYKVGSDIDIAINAPELKHEHYLRICNQLDDLMLPYKIDLVHIESVDNEELIHHIERVGIRVYDSTNWHTKPVL